MHIFTQFVHFFCFNVLEYGPSNLPDNSRNKSAKCLFRVEHLVMRQRGEIAVVSVLLCLIFIKASVERYTIHHHFSHHFSSLKAVCAKVHMRAKMGSKSKFSRSVCPGCLTADQFNFRTSAQKCCHMPVNDEMMNAECRTSEAQKGTCRLNRKPKWTGKSSQHSAHFCAKHDPLHSLNC